ncbi:cupin domain-containing protein [Mycobacterium sp. 050272]|uniref:cupin domain-containing protein n=1 Tax=Mycobacterium sp. 050272 TaxID=3142488 RepID=UPI0031925679
MHLGFETFVLEAGSSVSFDSAIPHAYVNEGTEAARGLWHVVGRNVPPAQQDSSAARSGWPSDGIDAKGPNGLVDGPDTSGVK